MASIPQRELRNNISAVLRRAERGERLVITVDGRPVAALGPVAGLRQAAPAASLRAILDDAPVDREWERELRRQRDDDAADARDPWAS